MAMLSGPNPVAPPGAMPPIGGMPPRPPAHVGPVTVPSANAGNQVAAKAAIKNATEALQSALPSIPMGSEQHTKVLKIVKELAALFADEAPDPHAQMQSLVAMARQASQGGPPPGLPGVMPAMPPPSPAPEAAQAA